MNALPVFLLLTVLTAGPALAHEGHDHGDGKKALAESGDTPQRRADGSVFLPKPAQRLIGVRTQPVVAGDAAPSVELAARVVGDPQRGGRVQTQLGGRIEAAAVGGLPMAGTRVKRGQVLAEVVPAAAPLDAGGSAAQLAELQAARALAGKRLARLRELADTVPGKEIEAAESELGALTARVAALGRGLNGRETLRAPVGGVVAASNVRLGEVVEARATLFEIVDPDSLVVEALAYEPLAVDDIVGATLAVGERTWPMQLLGAARQLREQALPLLFAHRGAQAGLALPLGQPVKIRLQLRSTAAVGEKPGFAVPSRALVRSPANAPTVWVKQSPEHFVPRLVRTQPLDGARVLIVDGLQPGDRVVVDGAALVNQIR